MQSDKVVTDKWALVRALEGDLEKVMHEECRATDGLGFAAVAWRLMELGWTAPTADLPTRPAVGFVGVRMDTNGPGHRRRTKGYESLRRLYRSQVDQLMAPYGFTLQNWLEKRGLPCREVMIEARRVLYAFFRNEGLTFPMIGRILDRDHSTIIEVLYGRHRKPRP